MLIVRSLDGALDLTIEATRPWTGDYFREGILPHSPERLELVSVIASLLFCFSSTFFANVCVCVEVDGLSHASGVSRTVRNTSLSVCLFVCKLLLCCLRSSF